MESIGFKVESERVDRMQQNSSAEHILTIADVSQFQGLFRGIFMKGYREPRIAVVGRSNVGKSSLLNALLGLRLAQVSKQPGKTRALHFYRWPLAKKILADLPGYGYAHASQEDRNRWRTFIEAYFEAETALEQVFVLLDARHDPSPQDREAIQFLSFQDIPATFVLTKVDALKTQSERALRRKKMAQALMDLGCGYRPTFWVSTLSGCRHSELKKLMNHCCLSRADNSQTEVSGE
jgi:GTP-binding protein